MASSAVEEGFVIGGREPSKMEFEECDQLGDGEVALLAAAEFGQEAVERDRPREMALDRFPEHHGSDRRQAQVGEEPSLRGDWLDRINPEGLAEQAPQLREQGGIGSGGGRHRSALSPRVHAQAWSPRRSVRTRRIAPASSRHAEAERTRSSTSARPVSESMATTAVLSGPAPGPIPPALAAACLAASRRAIHSHRSLPIHGASKARSDAVKARASNPASRAQTGSTSMPTRALRSWAPRAAATPSA